MLRPAPKDRQTLLEEISFETEEHNIYNPMYNDSSMSSEEDSREEELSSIFSSEGSSIDAHEERYKGDNTLKRFQNIPI